ncbi:MAG TPA: MogA/MoaB family molybdenum cofactor biosynthesis protein [Solirubrobacterales bacterium]|nr:MogA/MoaB family molybdenum cofactor biosynthesis protein [Solirubrobacterales bacterium]
MRAVVLTVSDSRARGEAEDESGTRLAAFAADIGAEVAAREVVPDEQPAIEARLRHWADEAAVDLVLTTGGTGFAPRDVTPEATRAVIEREAPGIGEAMRLASRDHVRLWMVSRGVAGVRGTTLIVNFPGSPKSIPEAGEAIKDALPHAVRLLRGKEH